MYKSQSNDAVSEAKSQHGYAEMDPSGRYGRFKEILGKGATKTVYKAFDEVLAMEVAWNQVKLNCVFQSPEELQRLYSEVHLLKNLNHNSIMQFHTSWINVHKKTFNFITEMFTAGSLREYRQKYKRVHIRAIKDWARQILEGLVYLHSHNPPVIHRDLKCDNIFINGHLGQVKIGDLGLATLCESQTAHSVIGTPEFMAPEMYEEDYNELVDIYSFGMCMLEMLTSEYPYSECSNPAQIYKKVTSGKFPRAFDQIECAEARWFVGKCLENVSTRPSAKALLMEPFLYVKENDQFIPIPKRPSQNPTRAYKIPEVVPSLVVHDQEKTIDMTITGSMNPEDGEIFLKVFISDKIGKARNIHFPFDVASDTAQDVATEMVKELDIKDWEPFDIAEMIDKEIGNLIPTWKRYPMELIRNLNHHSFDYDEDDDDDNNISHPFHSPSSQSSSQVSPRNLFYPFDSIQDQSEGITSSSAIDWTPGNIHDDASSYNSYNFTYCSDNEDDNHSRSFISQDLQHGEKAKNFTRLTTRGHRQNVRHDITKHKNIKR